MAKKRRHKAGSSKKRATKKRRTSKRKPTAKHAAAMAIRLKNAKTRVALHEAASKLADFHGGKSPIRSGCGRPRGTGRGRRTVD